MSQSLMLRGACIVDGTGTAARYGDVLVRNDRIAEVGNVLPPPDAEIVDLEGLVLAPGFIDVHTHYDAQILWDDFLTPSPWHGVTSVVLGNCGFGIAPTRPGDRQRIVGVLEKVEGMSRGTLEAGLSWDFTTFPEYLNAISSRKLGINVAVLVGHTPVRHFVMGDAALERAATSDEIAVMAEVVREAVAAGAVGFSTSRHAGHVLSDGRAIASRLASAEEVIRLAEVLGECGRGFVEITLGTNTDLSLDDLGALSARSGRPVSYSALLTGTVPKGEAVRRAEEFGALAGEVRPQISCRPLVMLLDLAEPGLLSHLPGFEDVLALTRGELMARYRDAAWRARVRAGVAGWVRDWSKSVLVETGCHGAILGRSLADLAKERSGDPFDTMLDLALADDLKSRFRLTRYNDDPEEVAALLNSPHTMLGLSDAGAHATQLCDACYPTDLLGQWVRDRKALTLEQAVWRLAGQPAAFLQWADRGRIVPGCVADLVAFDPARVGTEALERVWDFPGNTDRLVARSRGIEHVWVNGVAIRRHGVDLDSRPGRLIGA